MKNNKFRMTRDGIVESDDDSLNDILDSGSVDKNMAEMEEKMKKMMAMSARKVIRYHLHIRWACSVS